MAISTIAPRRCFASIAALMAYLKVSPLFIGLRRLLDLELKEHTQELTEVGNAWIYLAKVRHLTT
jgi:hypothetical protein